MGRLLSGIVVPFIGLAQLFIIFIIDYALWSCWINKVYMYIHHPHTHPLSKHYTISILSDRLCMLCYVLFVCLCVCKKVRYSDHKLVKWILPKTKTFKSTPIRRTLAVYYLTSCNYPFLIINIIIYIHMYICVHAS
jgi:hypothetical protein